MGSKGWIKQMFLEFSKKALVASPCFDRGKKQPTRRSISNWHSALCTTARVRCFFCSRETLPRNHQKPRGFFQLKLLNIDNTHYCHINQPCGHLFKSSQPIQASENFELPKKKKNIKPKISKSPSDFGIRTTIPSSALNNHPEAPSIA